MQVTMTINGEKKTFETAANRRLSDVLRDEFHLLSATVRCGRGICGACTVRLNGKTASSCIIPIALAQDAEIETLDNFATTDDYIDIRDALKNRNISLCREAQPMIFFGIDEILKKLEKTTTRKPVSRDSSKSFFINSRENTNRISPQVVEDLVRNFFINYSCDELDFANLLTTVRLAAFYRTKRLKNAKS